MTINHGNIEMPNELTVIPCQSYLSSAGGIPVPTDTGRSVNDSGKSSQVNLD